MKSSGNRVLTTLGPVILASTGSTPTFCTLSRAGKRAGKG